MEYFDRVVASQEGYDHWSSFYDTDDIPLSLLEEPVVDRDLGDVYGLKILELGCGTGRQTVRLATKGARVIAIDNSNGMLERAVSKKVNTIEFLKHDLNNPLPLETQSFDRVVSFLVLEHITNLETFFCQCRRICKPDGFLFFTTMHPAMLLKDVQARFIDPKSGERIYPKSYPYKVSDYLNAAVKAELKLVKMGEYSCSQEHAQVSQRAQKYLHWPLLLTLKFLP